MVGQQGVVPFGTEQSLRRTENTLGEVGFALRVHGLSSLRFRSVCRLDVMTIAQMSAAGCAIRHIAELHKSLRERFPSETMGVNVKFLGWRTVQCGSLTSERQLRADMVSVFADVTF